MFARVAIVTVAVVGVDFINTRAVNAQIRGTFVDVKVTMFTSVSCVAKTVVGVDRVSARTVDAWIGGTFIDVNLTVLTNVTIVAVTRITVFRLIVTRGSILTDSRCQLTLVNVIFASIPFTCRWTIATESAVRVTALAAIAEVRIQAFVDVQVAMFARVAIVTVAVVGVDCINTRAVVAQI